MKQMRITKSEMGKNKNGKIILRSQLYIRLYVHDFVQFVQQAY